MLYDGRGDYIRRYEPRRVPSPGMRMTAWLAALLVAGAFLWVSAAASNQASEPDQSFQQLFIWG
jgi:hypothetical protein